MKVRTCFVANSSSSSFGEVKIENPVLAEILARHRDHLQLRDGDMREAFELCLLGEESGRPYAFRFMYSDESDTHPSCPRDIEGFLMGVLSLIETSCDESTEASSLLEFRRDVEENRQAIIDATEDAVWSYSHKSEYGIEGIVETSQKFEASRFTSTYTDEQRVRGRLGSKKGRIEEAYGMEPSSIEEEPDVGDDDDIADDKKAAWGLSLISARRYVDIPVAVAHTAIGELRGIPTEVVEGLSDFGIVEVRDLAGMEDTVTAVLLNTEHEWDRLLEALAPYRLHGLPFMTFPDDGVLRRGGDMLRLTERPHQIIELRYLDVPLAALHLPEDDAFLLMRRGMRRMRDVMMSGSLFRILSCAGRVVSDDDRHLVSILNKLYETYMIEPVDVLLRSSGEVDLTATLPGIARITVLAESEEDRRSICPVSIPCQQGCIPTQNLATEIHVDNPLAALLDRWDIRTDGDLVLCWDEILLWLCSCKMRVEALLQLSELVSGLQEARTVIAVRGERLVGRVKLGIEQQALSTVAHFLVQAWYEFAQRTTSEEDGSLVLPTLIYSSVLDEAETVLLAPESAVGRVICEALWSERPNWDTVSRKIVTLLREDVCDAACGTSRSEIRELLEAPSEQLCRGLVRELTHLRAEDRAFAFTSYAWLSDALREGDGEILRDERLLDEVADLYREHARLFTQGSLRVAMLPVSLETVRRLRSIGISSVEELRCDSRLISIFVDIANQMSDDEWADLLTPYHRAEEQILARECAGARDLRRAGMLGKKGVLESAAALDVVRRCDAILEGEEWLQGCEGQTSVE